MVKRIEEEETRKILATLNSGVSLGESAKRHGRSKGAVSNIAKRHGVTFERSRTKKAAKATREYAEAERLILSDELFEKLRGLAESTLDSGDFRDLVVSFGILTDKRRLETGEATSRHESVDPERRRRMRESLDEVAARRRKRAG